MPELGAQLRKISRWFLLPALPVLLHAQSIYSTPYAFTTLAGASSIGSTDGPGSAARFYLPQSVARDAAGNLFVADSANRTIRRITRTGIVSTFAGAPGEPGTTNGTGGSARFSWPQGVAVDLADNVIVADAGAIRRITPAGGVSTLAGVAGELGHADGAGSAARFRFPHGVVVDAAGNVIVADAGNHTIRRITPAGTVTTLAGAAGEAGSEDGPGSAARFNNPNGVAADASGNLYVADSWNHTIRLITPAGIVSTLAGSPGNPGIANGPVATARFNYPNGLAVDAVGNVLVADSANHTIRRITPAGVVTTIAGNPGTRGGADGTGSAARFDYPSGVVSDADGSLYIAEASNNVIRRMTAAGVVTTLAGLALESAHGSADGPGPVARFQDLHGIATGPDDEIYVADTGNHTIRVISPTGTVRTLAGAAGVMGSSDGFGSVARFNAPVGIAVDSAANVYVADTRNHTIRLITPAGIVTTVAGVAGSAGQVDGTGGAARFSSPTHLAIDAVGNIYVVDDFQSVIRRISPAGSVTTLPGTAGNISAPDGTAPANPFYETIEGVAVDPAGELYASYQTQMLPESRYSPTFMVRKFAADGTMTIRAGAALRFGSQDGADASAGYQYIRDLAISRPGTLYLVNSGGRTIRKVTAAGQVSTLAGLTDAPGSADGVGRAARFNFPTGIALDSAGNLYVTDATTVRKGQLAGPPAITTQPKSLTVAAGGDVSFSVIATGVPAPTYQWYYNGSLFAGATASSLSFTSAHAADAGDYTVAVANALGSTISSKATLTLAAAPTPTPPPAPAPSSGGGGGGGGAIDAWFALALLALGALRRLTVRPTA